MLMFYLLHILTYTLIFSILVVYIYISLWVLSCMFDSCGKNESIIYVFIGISRYCGIKFAKENVTSTVNDVA